MNINKYAKENAIITIETGSHLYGMSTPESDHDYMGVFLPPVDYIFGLKNVEQVNCGFYSKNEKGKNTKEAIDYIIYDIRKYIKLALGCNPNIIELLFVNEKNIKIINSKGRILLENKKNFLSKVAYNKFMGYAQAQRKKMIVKKDTYNNLKRFQNFINNLDIKFDNCYLENVLDVVLGKEYQKSYKLTAKGISVGDIFIPVNIFIKRARKIVNNRCEKIGNREELYSKYSYDVKFASHAIRLLTQGIELLSTGNIEFPLRNKNLLLDIRKGKYTLEEVTNMAIEYENIMRSFKDKNVLPEKCNYDKIEKLQMSLLYEAIHKDYKEA
jgi:uncharacterized protein